MPAPVERRRNVRHRSRVELRYTASERRTEIASGNGWTCDISDTGLAFQTEVCLPEGAAVEVVIQWPVVFDGVCPVQVQAGGKVVRSAAGTTVLEVAYWEFRAPGICYHYNSAARSRRHLT